MESVRSRSTFKLQVSGYHDLGKRRCITSILGELEIIAHQAEACCDELHFAPMADEMLFHSDLGQIEISRVKEQIQ